MKSLKNFRHSNFSVLTGNFILFDQVLVSASNFLFTIYLANLLSASDFDIFAAVFILYLSISSIQSSIFIAPLYALEKKGLTEIVFNEIRIFYFVFLTIVLSILFFSHNIITEILNISTDSSIIFKLVFALLNIEFYRRILLKLNNAYILLYDFIFYILVPLLFYYFGFSLSELSTIYFISTLVVILTGILVYPIKLNITHFNKNRISLYWNFSRWLLYSAVLQFFSGNYIAIYAAGIIGSGVYGIVRVFQNIQGVFNLALQYMDTKLAVNLPLVERYEIKESVKKSTILVVTLSFVMFAVLHLIGLDRVMLLLYNNKLTEFAYIINYVFILYLLSLVNVIYRNILKVNYNTSPILFAGLVSCALVLVLLSVYQDSWGVDGYYLINALSLFGALITYMFVQIFKSSETRST